MEYPHTNDEIILLHSKEKLLRFFKQKAKNQKVPGNIYIYKVFANSANDCSCFPCNGDAAGADEIGQIPVVFIFTKGQPRVEDSAARDSGHQA